MTNGRLTMTEGLLSARLEVNAHIDAAVVTPIGRPDGALAGLELEVVDAAVTIGPNSSYRAATTVSLSMHPGTMESLLMLLADKLDLPAFTEREWKEIASLLSCLHASNADPYVERIRSAYSRS